VILSVRLAAVDRADVYFSSDGINCAGWLYRPAADGPAPLVVMAHGFSATRELRLDAYAERFCAAGLGVLLFDYRHFGSSGGEPRQLLEIGKQQADYRAAIAYVRALDGFDPDRIALFGSSFSGGHVIAVAAEDHRLAAIVAQCPFTDGIASMAKAKAPASIMVMLTLEGARDQAGALAGRPPRYIPAVGPPGTLAVMSTPDAQPGFESIVPPQTRWENRVAARIALRIAAYRPGRAAGKVTCPALFCVCDHDTLTPAETTVKLASAAPRGEIKRYPVGHFDIYVGDMFEQAVADQTEFLVRSLAPVAVGAGAS